MTGCRGNHPHHTCPASQPPSDGLEGPKPLEEATSDTLSSTSCSRIDERTTAALSPQNNRLEAGGRAHGQISVSMDMAANYD